MIKELAYFILNMMLLSFVGSDLPGAESLDKITASHN